MVIDDWLGCDAYPFMGAQTALRQLMCGGNGRRRNTQMQSF